MRAFHFPPNGRPEALEPDGGLPGSGYVWLDFVREESPDWPQRMRETTGLSVFEAHVVDSLNLEHPSFCDATDEYEMIVFRGLAPDSSPDDLRTRPTAFFVFDRALVTVRAGDAVSIPAITRRLQERTSRVPRRPAGLLHLFLNAIIDRFLELRDPLARQMETWQDTLLDPMHPFDDWLELMRHKKDLRRLENLSEEQLDALRQWKEAAGELDDSLAVRFTDLAEHVHRVMSHAVHLQSEIDSLVQIHFAAVSHRTNEVMRVLTVLTAVFLPLTLIVGIFGMNFENMPELKLPWAYYATLAAMVTVALLMLAWFRRKRWI